jgi:hypothetical protein
MKTFTIVAHLEFPTKGEPVTSGSIRLQIPATCEEEARQKAAEFILTRMNFKIDSCTPPKPASWADEMARITEQFKDVFRGK